MQSQAPRTLLAIDSLLATTALHHYMTLVTRNVADFRDCQGLELLNPWHVQIKLNGIVMNKTFIYKTYVKEVYLDTFGHMNNAVYLVLIEEARWEILALHGYGVEKIAGTGLGPTILEINLRFKKELKLRDNIEIHSQLSSYAGKIAKMTQNIMRGDDVCCAAEVTFGLFSLSERKLVLPTQDWLRGLGVE